MVSFILGNFLFFNTEVESGGEEERPTERAKFVATEEQLEDARTAEMRTIAYDIVRPLL